MPIKDPEARRKYHREWMAARRAEYFNGKVCASCGSDEQLELDHIDPSQKVTHNIWSWAKSRRDAELAKCQVLCQPCHLMKTKEMYSTSRKHGTANMYSNWGCRCQPCRDANAAKRRKYRATKIAD